MYEKILVPLDGTRFAEEALPMAASVAERSGAELHLVSVVTHRPPLRVAAAGESEEAYVQAWVSDKHQRAEEYLADVTARVRDGGYEGGLETEILSGTPVDRLDEWVRETGVDLVVMTSHARGPLERAWLGSVADGLARRGPCPILLWRPVTDEGPALAERPAFHHILVPLDGSERGVEGAWKGVPMARIFGARITVVGVAPPTVPEVAAYPAMAPLEYEHEIAREREHLKERLEQDAAAVAGELGTSVEVHVVSHRDPATAILAHREDVAADLVALSTRGHGGVARMVLGSVADKVIRGGRVPVLIHRPAEE